MSSKRWRPKKNNAKKSLTASVSHFLFLQRDYDAITCRCILRYRVHLYLYPLVRCASLFFLFCRTLPHRAESCTQFESSGTCFLPTFTRQWIQWLGECSFPQFAGNVGDSRSLQQHDERTQTGPTCRGNRWWYSASYGILVQLILKTKVAVKWIFFFPWSFFSVWWTFRRKLSASCRYLLQISVSCFGKFEGSA